MNTADKWYTCVNKFLISAFHLKQNYLGRKKLHCIFLIGWWQLSRSRLITRWLHDFSVFSLIARFTQASICRHTEFLVLICLHSAELLIIPIANNFYRILTEFQFIGFLRTCLNNIFLFCHRVRRVPKILIETHLFFCTTFSLHSKLCLQRTLSTFN